MEVCRTDRAYIGILGIRKEVLIDLIQTYGKKLAPRYLVQKCTRPQQIAIGLSFLKSNLTSDLLMGLWGLKNQFIANRLSNNLNKR